MYFLYSFNAGLMERINISLSEWPLYLLLWWQTSLPASLCAAAPREQLLALCWPPAVPVELTHSARNEGCWTRRPLHWGLQPAVHSCAPHLANAVPAFGFLFTEHPKMLVQGLDVTTPSASWEAGSSSASQDLPINIFIRIWYWSLSKTRLIQSAHPHPVVLRFILKISSHVHTRLSRFSCF